jgi:hypothetical protein
MKIIIIMAVMASHLMFSATYQSMTDLGTSAGMIGLGNIHGFEQSSNVLFDNPAGLNFVKGISGGSFFTELMGGEIQYKNGSVGLKTHVGTFAIGYMGAMVDGIPKTAEKNGEFIQLGSFGYKNQLAKLGYAFELTQRVLVGMNLVGIHHEIDTVTGTAVNADVGGMLIMDRLNLNVVLQNAMFWNDLVYSNGGKEKIPTTVIGGIKYSFLKDVDMYVQLKTFLRERHQLTSVGISYQPLFMARWVTFRVGIKEFLIMNDVHTSTTLGIGLDLINIGFDFAYEKSSYFEVDAKNYFSFRVNI